MVAAEEADFQREKQFRLVTSAATVTAMIFEITLPALPIGRLRIESIGPVGKLRALPALRRLSAV